MNKEPGYVYILSNPAFRDDIIKIGMTRRDPSQRASEIYTTGVPMEFVVAYERRVLNCVVAEMRIHSILEKARINRDREFFRLTLASAKLAFEAVCQSVDLSCGGPENLEDQIVVDRIKSATKSNPNTFISTPVEAGIIHEAHALKAKNATLVSTQKVATRQQPSTSPATHRQPVFERGGCLAILAWHVGLFIYIFFAGLILNSVLAANPSKPIGLGFGIIIIISVFVFGWFWTKLLEKWGM